MSQDADQLRDWERRIEAFLRETLALRLNERRNLRPLSDGIDFLGYVIRTDYRLVRRRVIGSLVERLVEAERRLRQAGMGERDGRWVQPWPAALVERLKHWLTAYLAQPVGRTPTATPPTPTTASTATPLPLVRWSAMKPVHRSRAAWGGIFDRFVAGAEILTADFHNCCGHAGHNIDGVTIFWRQFCAQGGGWWGPNHCVGQAGSDGAGHGC